MIKTERNARTKGQSKNTVKERTEEKTQISTKIILFPDILYTTV